jgi:hypothetical protein
MIQKQSFEVMLQNIAIYAHETAAATKVSLHLSAGKIKTIR